MSIGLIALGALGLVWVGYPIVLWLVARLVPARASRWSGELPPVSVIIATRGSTEDARRRVEDILATSYPLDRLEVLVVVDGSLGDEVVERMREALTAGSGRVQVLRGPAPGGKALSVNAGVALARSPLLVMADTAQRFEATTIGALVDALADPRVGAASGRLEVARGRPRTLAELYWSMERRLRRDEARLHSAIGVTGAVYAQRRELFTPFPPGLILDDLYGPMTLVLRGFRIAYADDAIAVETRAFGAVEEQRRKVRTLTGVIQLCRLLPAVLVPIRNPVWVQFVMHKLLRFASPVLAGVALVGFGAAAWHAIVAWPSPGMRVLAGAGFVVALLVAVLYGPVQRAVTEFVRMNAAVVQAAVNGIRGRWDVW